MSMNKLLLASGAFVAWSLFVGFRQPTRFNMACLTVNCLCFGYNLGCRRGYRIAEIATNAVELHEALKALREHTNVIPMRKKT